MFWGVGISPQNASCGHLRNARSAESKGFTTGEKQGEREKKHQSAKKEKRSYGQPDDSFPKLFSNNSLDFFFHFGVDNVQTYALMLIRNNGNFLSCEIVSCICRWIDGPPGVLLPQERSGRRTSRRPTLSPGPWVTSSRR